MSTTTMRLLDELKARVLRAAERAGTTPHAFIVEAIAEKAKEAELRSTFHDEAERRCAEIVQSGETIPWSEMRIYLNEHAAGRDAPRPKARKLGR